MGEGTPIAPASTITRSAFLDGVRGKELEVSTLPADVQAAARRYEAVDRDGVIRKWDRFFTAADRPDRDGSVDSVTARRGEEPTWSANMLTAATGSAALRALTPPSARGVRPAARTTDARPPEGGGRPQNGVASFYTMGKLTANGERWGNFRDGQGVQRHHSDRTEHIGDYRERRGAVPAGLTPETPIYTAAHKTLPFGTIVRVDVPGREPIYARINDRGPYVAGRIIDLSRAAARATGLADGQGVSRVTVTPTGLRVDPTVEAFRSPREGARRW